MPMGNMVPKGKPSKAMGLIEAAVGTYNCSRIIDSERRWELDRRSAYAECRQHDKKMYDFDGRVIAQGGVTQPALSSEVASWFVPLRDRKPSSPYRLAKIINTAFTNMVFGENRFPTVRCAGDDDTEDYAGALSKAMSLPVNMIRARDMGGACGTVGLSWCYRNGRPRMQVHNARNLFVLSWADRDELLPKHVVEVYLYPKDDWDGDKRAWVRNLYWYRRDWTPDVDVAFKPVLFERGVEPDWTMAVDVDRSAEHNDGLAHFVWIQNLPAEGEDGLPDYDGLYDSFDTIDMLYSVISRGATLNLDPTLVLKMSPDKVARMGVKKGSDNALLVGTDGAAEYLELGGQSIQAGIALFESKKRAALEVAQCVVPNPDEVAAGNTSGVARKIIYAPMLGKCDVLREQYGKGIAHLLEPMVVVARAASKSTVVVYDTDGNASEEKHEVYLPQRAEEEPVIDDETGQPTGETNVTMKDRNPGEGEDIDLEWGEYFSPTPDDQSKVVTALGVATGQQAFMSTQTASEIAMKYYGRNAQEEYKRVLDANQAISDKHDQMFGGDMGGQVSHTQQLPDGSTVKKTAQLGSASETASESGADDDVLGISPDDLANIVTVNEVRQAKGLGDVPDGDLTITEYKAKNSDKLAQAKNAEKGQVGDPPDAKPKAPPGMPGGPPGAPGGAPPFGAKPPGAHPGMPGAPPPGMPPKGGPPSMSATGGRPPAPGGFGPPKPKKPPPF